MSVKAICIDGCWTVRVNWRKLRKSKRVTPNTQERAEQVADSVRMALKIYGMDAFRMLGDAPAIQPRPIDTVRSFSERWLAEIEKGDLKLSTRKMYASNLKHHILPALGETPLADLDYPTIKAFILEKKDATYSTGRFRTRKYKRTAKQQKYSRDSIRVMVMTLRAMLAEAVREKLIPENPAKDLAALYRRRKKDRVVTRAQVFELEELYAIEDKLGNRTLYGGCYEMALTMSRTGMRIGEARGLQWDDIDWREGKIRIARNIPSGTGIEEDSAKTAAGERLVDMSDELSDVLRALQVSRKAEGLKTGRRGHGTVFQVRYEQFHEAWRRAQAQADVRYRSPHSIRHTYASQMLAAGCDIAWLANQLGHASAAVTLGIYAHFIPGKKQQAANVLDRKNANKVQTEAGS